MMAVADPPSQDLLEKIKELIETTGVDSSLFIHKLKSVDLKSLSLLDVVYRLVAAGILGDLPSLSEKIHKLINTSVYCLVQLEQLRTFNSEEDALTKIESLKGERRDRSYFEGSFNVLTQKKVFLFEYKWTKKASDAVIDDFHLEIENAGEHQIFPSCGSFLPIVRIDVKIFCVSQTTLDMVREEASREGSKRTQKRAQKRVAEIEDLDEQTKLKVQKILEDATSGPDDDPVPLLSTPVTPVTPMPPLFVRPDENSQTAHIMEQIKEYAVNNNFTVLSDSSTSTDIPHVQKYSKYASSRPDLSLYKDSTALFIFKGTGIAQKMETMSVDGEGKTKDAANKIKKDAIGQLLASMNKTLGDIVYLGVKHHSRIVDTVTMYGLYFVAEENTCEVYKATVKANRPTKVQRTVGKGGISDAVNKVFHEFSVLYNTNRSLGPC
jgi:hypothetical protein